MSIVQNTKEFLKLLQQIDNIELLQRFIKIQNEVLELQLDRQRLMDRVNELEKEHQISASIEHHYGTYWKKRDDGSLDGPFSTNGWDRERKLIRLHYVRHVDDQEGKRHEWKDVNGEFIAVPSSWAENNQVFPDGETPSLQVTTIPMAPTVIR